MTTFGEGLVQSAQEADAIARDLETLHRERASRPLPTMPATLVLSPANDVLEHERELRRAVMHRFRL